MTAMGLSYTAARAKAEAELWLELGKFIHAFSSIESSLLQSLRQICGLRRSVAEALFANMRAADAIRDIRRVLSASPRLAKIESILAHIAAINDARNKIVHRSMIYDPPHGFIATTQWVKRPGAETEDLLVTPELLKAMAEDLEQAEMILLFQVADWRKKPGPDEQLKRWRKEARALRQKPWQYTPPQPARAKEARR